MKKKILAAAWHPGSANAIVPVIQRLNCEDNVEVVTIGYQYSEKIFTEKNIKYETISAYNLKNVSVESMACLLEAESPDLVFTGASMQSAQIKDVIEQTLILAARKKGVKTLALLDFWANPSLKFSDAHSNEKFKFLPDKIAIPDKFAEEIMINEGFDAKNLVITGNPYYDELVTLKKEFSQKDKLRIRHDLRFGPDDYIILYASQPIEYDHGSKFGYTEKTALRELLDAVKDLRGKRKMSILVKVHPRENQSNLEAIIKDYDLRVIVNKTYPIRPAVLASDIIISPSSTTLVESSYLDLPSISLQPGLINPDKDILVTNKLGITVPVYKHGEIKFVLEKLLFDNNYNLELAEKRKDFRTDGKATGRVVDLIYSMLN